MNTLIDEEVEAFVEKSEIPQLELGIWHKGALFKESFGKTPKPEVDVFEIGSIGKTFTATLLAILVENGTVSLNDTVEKFRPELPFAKDITLRQLVTHTAGLPNDPFRGLILNAEKALRNFSEADYNGYLSGIKKPLKTGKFKYSNLGMALLGNLLAEHVNMPYEKAIKHHLLEPLGMSDTHVSPTAFEDSRVAVGHSGSGKTAPHFHWPCMEPAGVWRSTTLDMLVFLKAHLGYSGEAWKNLLDKTTSPAFDDPKLHNLGLAWQLSNNAKLGACAWHNGQTLGQKSMAVCAKTNDSAIVVLSNKAPKLWQGFFVSYSIEQLASQLLESLSDEK